MQTLDHNLTNEIEGEVLYPGQPGFAEAAASWCLIIQHQPDVIVIPNTTADVQSAVRYANSNGMKITVQVTGHGQPKTCEGGMLLVMKNFTSVTVDAEAKTARVQGGAKFKDVIAPAFAIGLAPLCGSSPEVGVVGYMLGGGVGITLRTFGLGIDSVRSFEVVTADGELRTASATENPNLYWGLKGGGGTFGVVTEIEIGLYPCAMLYGGSMMFPFERAEEILTAYANWTATLPCEATVTATIMNFPPIPIFPEHLQGKAFVMVMGALCTDEATAQEMLKPISDLGPIMSDFAMIPFTASAMIYKDPTDPTPAAGQGMLLERFTPESVKTLLDALGDISQSPNLKIDVRFIGRRNAELHPGTSSLDSLRDADYLLFMLGAPMGPVTLDMIESQAESVFARMASDAYCQRGFLNWIGERNIPADRIEKCFGADDLKRLREIKHEVDPENTFANASIGIG